MASDDTPAFIQDWYDTRPTRSWSTLVPTPSGCAVFSADMINAFVHEGPLSSAPVHALIEPVRRLFAGAWDHGVRDFVLVQDTHHPATPEFEAYPAHAIAGTTEAETIPELMDLPFADAFTVIEKNALAPGINTAFDHWLQHHPAISTAIVVGNCTDLCTYHLAMYLRMRANAHNLTGYRVIVPMDCVDTFDIPVGGGLEPGAAHPGPFFHRVFLYHMAQNGIEIVSSITPEGR
jgi:nicotinamidase-related amidase